MGKVKNFYHDEICAQPEVIEPDVEQCGAPKGMVEFHASEAFTRLCEIYGYFLARKIMTEIMDDSNANK